VVLTAEPPRIEPRSAAYRTIGAALFAAGLVAFSSLYSVQPLLPTFSTEFGVTPATASLAVSVTTGAMAVCLMIAGTLSESLGRKPTMSVSLVGAAVITLALGFAPTFGVILLLRALLGVFLSGLSAVAMAYLGEEVQPTGLGLAVGLYIGGNGIGGMSGRIVLGALSDAVGWRAALVILGLISLACAVWFWTVLPPSRHFRASRMRSVRAATAPIWAHLRDPGLRYLFAIGFVLMACQVSLFNYLTFLLEGPPYGFTRTQVGWVFLVYLLGTGSSTVMGRLGDRFGRRRVLWASIAILILGPLVSLAGGIVPILLGASLFTVGFFGSHSVASSWVTRRATTRRAQASALYLFFFYVGASVGGWGSGFSWAAFGWPGVVTGITALGGVGILLALRLTRVPRLA
jgi:YNFM family putative membrane transporter